MVHNHGIGCTVGSTLLEFKGQFIFIHQDNRMIEVAWP